MIIKIKHILLFLVLLLPTTSCFKEDTVAPVILLNGASYLYVQTGEIFKDPGVTATDDRDGDITYLVKTSGELNSDLAGEYKLKYNVVDASGNPATEAVRNVYITHINKTLAGIYLAKSACETDTSGYYVTLSAAGTNEDEVKFSNIINNNLEINSYLKGTTGQNFTLQSLTYSDTTYYGYGNIDGEGNQIDLTVIRKKQAFSDTCLIIMKR